MGRTVAGLERLGQAIRDSDVPLEELEVPLKMCAAPPCRIVTALFLLCWATFAGLVVMV